LDLQTPTQRYKQIDSDIKTEKDRHFRHTNQRKTGTLDIQTNKDKFLDLQTPTQTYKQIDSDIQTEKERHFKRIDQQRQTFELANTNPDIQTNRFRHINRETYKQRKAGALDIQTNKDKHLDLHIQSNKDKHLDMQTPTQT
jgi:hypothetical protein